MAFIEWVDAAQVIEEKAAEEKKTKRKEPEPKRQQTAPEREELKPEEPKHKEPAAKEEKPAPKALGEESKPKKRRWFGKKSGDEGK
jgi:hypothetical protein